MPDTDFGGLAESRLNKELDGLDKLTSKQEYKKKLEEYLRQSKNGQRLLNAKTKSWDSIADEMYEESSAKDIIEKNKEKIEEEDVKSRAIRFELARDALSRNRDEKVTARDTRRITVRNFNSWRNRPSRFDLRGIDTRRRMSIGRGRRGVDSSRIMKRVLITDADRRLKSYRVWIDPVRRYKAYRSVSTGRFVKNPFARK